MDHRKAVRFLAGRLAAACLLTFLAAACDRGNPSATAGVKQGSYRAVLQVPGGDLPFELELSREESAWVGYLVNGPERVKLCEVAVDGRHLEIKMPGYENRLTADAEGEQLRGEVVLNKLEARTSTSPCARNSVSTTGSFRNPPAILRTLREGTRSPSPKTAARAKPPSGNSRNRMISSAEHS